MSSLVKNNNNFRKAANKVLQQTRTINNLKPEITVEQTFDEPLFVKNMILSALGQDPQHDFYSRTGEKRTFLKKPKNGCRNDIAGEMIQLFELCSYRYKRKRLEGGGWNPSPEQEEYLKKRKDEKEGEKEELKSKYIISTQMDDTEFQLYKKNVIEDFTKNITIAFFSDIITKSIYAAGRLLQKIREVNNVEDKEKEIKLDTNTTYFKDNKDKKIDTVLSYGKMGNIIADSFYNYQENKKIKAIKGIKEKYINPIKKLINKEGTLKGVSTVWEKIEEVEKGLKTYYENMITEYDHDDNKDDNNLCLFSEEEAISLMNDYIDKAKLCVPERVKFPCKIVDYKTEFEKKGKGIKRDMVKKIRNAIYLVLHPDKCDKNTNKNCHLFTEINDNMDNIYNSCFILGEELEITSAFKKNEYQSGGKNGPKKEKCKSNQLSKINKQILNESTKFMMNWCNALKYKNTNNNNTSLSSIIVDPNLSSIIVKNKGNTKYKKESESNVNAGEIINVGILLYNIQIIILWVHIQDKRRQEVKQYILDKQLNGNLDILYEKFDEWWVGPHSIDDNLQNAYNIVLREYFPNIIYSDNKRDKNDNYPFPAEYNFKLPIAPKGQKFIVNNASGLPSANPKQKKGETKRDFLARSKENEKWKLGNQYDINEVNDRIFCPIASILDAMTPCSINNALKQKKDALYNTTYIIRDTNGNFTYTVNYKTIIDKEDALKKGINLSATLSNFISGNLFTIDKKFDSLKSNDLSATSSYREIIKQFFNKFKEITLNNNVRAKNAEEALQLFLVSVMKEVIGYFAIKSIGDYAQEGTVTSKYLGSKDNNSQSQSTATLTPIIGNGDSFKIGLSGDRPSAYRMIFQLLFAKKDSVNNGAIVGYLGNNDQKNFLVHAFDMDKTYKFENLLPTKGGSKTRKNKKVKRRKTRRKKTSLPKSKKKTKKVKKKRRNKTKIKKGGNKKKHKKRRNKKNKKKKQLFEMSIKELKEYVKNKK